METTKVQKSSMDTQEQKEALRPPRVKHVPSKKRWFMLCIFILFTFINSLQWGQYIIISNLVIKYYHVTSVDVDWTMVVYMAAYIPLIFPGLWFLDKVGTRYSLIISSGGLCAGVWIKVYGSMASDRFSYVMLGQGTEAVFQVLAFGLAAKVAAIWFGANEVSFACALAVFGDQLGSAVGFLMPAMMVKNNDNIAEIGENLTQLNLWIAIPTTIAFLLTILSFKDQPKIPPSAAQALQKKIHKRTLMEHVLKACQRKSFILVLIAYGMNVATFNAYITVLNDEFKLHFQKENEIHIGYIGFLIMASGIVGSVLFGYLFDKTHLFKELTLFLYIFSGITLFGNIYILQAENLTLFYVSHILIGFFMIGFYSVGIQLAIEKTYPLSEDITSSLLLLSSHIMGVPVTKLCRYVFSTKGELYANLGLCALLLIGSILTCMVPPTLRRQLAERKAKQGSILV